jgi:hypothetical protein
MVMESIALKTPSSGVNKRYRDVSTVSNVLTVFTAARRSLLSSHLLVG